MTVPAIAIEAHGVDFAYGDRPQVLANVHLEITERDFVSVIGPNGGGKTTLIKLFLGLLRPTAGDIRVLGTTPQKARTQIGYMPQHATLDPGFPVSVGDVVLMGRLGHQRWWGSYSADDRAIAADSLDRAGLASLQRAPFASLSGGQRQRALLARALTCRPRLLLLDEPEAGLDLKVEHEFFDLLTELNRDITVVIVSHDIGFVSSYVRTVVCVNHRVEVHPTTEMNGRRVSEVYGGEMRMVRHDVNDTHCHSHG